MSKYDIKIKVIEAYYLKVEAANEDEAIEKATNDWDEMALNDKYKFHDDSDVEFEAFETS